MRQPAALDPIGRWAQPTRGARAIRPARFLIAVVVLLVSVGPNTDAVVGADKVKRLVDAANKAEDPTKKIEHLTAALDLSPKARQLWEMRAEAYILAGQFDLAIADADQVIRLDGKQWTGWAIRARANLLAARPDACVSDATEAHRCDSNQVIPLSLRAEAYLRKGDLQSAIRDASDGLGIDGKYIPCLRIRASAQSGLGQNNAAIEDLSAALDVAPKHLDTLAQRIDILLSLKRADDAAKDLKYMEEIAPDAPLTRGTRAKLSAAQGHPEEAIALAEQNVKDHPESVDHWSQLALYQMQSKMWAEAAASCDKVIEINSHLAVAYSWRASANRGRREFDLAVADATKAIELDPDLAEAYGVRGAVYWEGLRKPDEAVRDLSKALQLDTKNMFALAIRSLIYRHLGKLDSSLEDADRFLRLAPDDRTKAEAEVARAAGLRLMGNREGALKALDRAMRLDPKNPFACMERAMANLKTDPSAALADCDRGIALDPKEPFGHVVREVCLFEKAARIPQGVLNAAAIAEVERELQQAGRLDRYGDYTAYIFGDLAEIERLSNRHELAIQHASRAIAGFPLSGHVRAYSARAAARRAKGQFGEAISDCDQVLRRDPKNSFAYAERAAAHRATRAFDRAIDDCSRAIDLNPDFPFAFHERAYACLDKFRGETSEQEAMPGKLLFLTSGFGGPSVPFELARSEDVSLKNVEVMVSRKAAPRRPYTAEFVPCDKPAQLSSVLEQAAADFGMLLQMSYDPRSTGFGLAQCLYEMQRFQEASDLCDRIIAKHGGSPDLFTARSQTYLALGKIPEALSDATRAVKSAPENPDGRLMQAVCQLATGKWAECRKTCETGFGQPMSPAAGARLALVWHSANMHEVTPKGSPAGLRSVAARLRVSPSEWPVPLLDAILVDQGPDQLVHSLAAIKDEAIAKRRLSQTFHYFALADLGSGRIAEAKEKLERVVAIGTRQCFEYTLAEAELQRLRTNEALRSPTSQ